MGADEKVGEHISLEQAEAKVDSAMKPFLQAQKKLVQQRLQELKTPAK